MISRTQVASRLAMSIMALAAIVLVACQEPAESTPTSDSGDTSPTATTLSEPTPTADRRDPSTPAATPTARPVDPTPTSPARDAPLVPASTPSPATAPRSEPGTPGILHSPDFRSFEGAVLVGADDEEIGVLLPADLAINSICDNLTEGGAAFGPRSIFNEFSVYGGPFGANSPFNPNAVSPPRIVLNGAFIGHLTVSTAFVDPIDPFPLLSHLGCPTDSNQTA